MATESGDTAASESGEDLILGRDLMFDHKTRSRMLKTAEYISALIVVMFGAFPHYWMVQNAFKSRKAILEGISFLPLGSAFSIDHFNVIFRGDVSTYIVNSVIVTIGTIVMVSLVALIAGYGLARFDFKRKVSFARFLLLGYMFSPIVLALPLYLIWDSIGLLNTHIGLIIALAAISMPFAVWLMWKYMQTLPESMEESAWMAGAPRWRGFVDIILPQTKPALIANALFAFAIAWNDFTFAQILLPKNEATTLPPGLLRLVHSSYQTGFGDFMAVGFLMTFPAMMFAYFLQSYMLEGFQIRSL